MRTLVCKVGIGFPYSFILAQSLPVLAESERIIAFLERFGRFFLNGLGLMKKNIERCLFDLERRR
jgi:hypothetical protein